MSDDKTEPPTEHRLEEARKDGQVANSPDATAAVAFVAVLGCLTAFSAWGVLRLELLFHMVMGYINEGETPLTDQALSLLMQLILMCVPLALLGSLGGILGGAIQGSVTMAFKKIELNMDAVNPIAGMKRLFSSRTLVEGGKLLFKLMVFGALICLAVLSVMPLVIGGTAKPPSVISHLLWEVLTKFMWISVGLIGLMAVVDYKLQHWLFIRENRMSQEDIKRENKEQNGDPEIKHKQKEFARELLDGPLPDKNKVNVVLANPTHYCVALSHYGNVGIPIVVAKGQDEKAFLIRRWAEAEGIPVIEQPALARRLFLVAVGDPIPKECYQAVAVVLQWVRAIGRNDEVLE
jgi:type III secretion protein U